MTESQTLFSLEPLVWESGFFGFRTAKFTLNPKFAKMLMSDKKAEETLLHHSVINGLPWQEYEVIQSKVDMRDLSSIDLLSQLNFKLAEGEMDFIYSTHSLNTIKSTNNFLEADFSNTLKELAEQFTIDVEIKTATSLDIPELKSIALNLFEQSRFRTPWFKEGQSGQFYATWIEKAVLAQYDHICFVIKSKQHEVRGSKFNTQLKSKSESQFVQNTNYPQASILGFVTLRLSEKGEVRIGLLGSLNKKLENKQPIGTSLVQIAKAWSRLKNASALYVATQSSNIPAMRLYLKTGATVCSSSYWMYRLCAERF